MSDLDDRIRTALDEVGAAAPDDGRVASDVVRRRTRRDRTRRIQAAGLALVVIAGTVAGYAALQGRFASSSDPAGTPTPGSSSPTPSITRAPDGSTTIPGIPGTVCRPMTISGSFGDVGDEVVVYEESACKDSKGFQHIAILSDGVAVAASGPIDVGNGITTPAWPFATPDIDGDGFSEIMLGFDGSRDEGFVRIAPFAVQVNDDDVRITNLSVDCEVVLCDSEQTFTLGLYPGSQEQGAYCGTLPGDPRHGLIVWEIQRDPIRAVDVLLVLEGDELLITDTTQVRESESSAGQPNGMLELCGAPTFFPEDFGAEPQPSIDEEGRDIGLGSNVCEVTRLGGLNLVADELPDTAWTGYLVGDDGRCTRAEYPKISPWIAAADLDGDGAADAFTELPDLCEYQPCSPWDATDLDADGDDELIVIASFSIVDQLYLAAERTGDGSTLRLLEIASPGHLPALLPPGEPLITNVAGDAGYAAWIRCEGYPEDPILVHTWASAIIDSDEPTEWHETKLELREDGMFHVVATNDLRLPPDQDPDWILSNDPACGVDFNPWAPPNP